MDNIKVRWHHLRNLKYILWRFGYSRLRNKNYSEFYVYYYKGDYAKNTFKKIIENPYLKIKITACLDNICSACGENDGTNCTNPTEDAVKLKLLDMEIISDFGLDVGRSYSSDDLLFRLRQHIDDW